jgi:hypothetical protein
MKYIKLYESFQNEIEKIIEDLRKTDISDDIIKSEFGQNNKFIVIDFLQKGRPSEYYLNKVKELIKKYQ